MAQLMSEIALVMSAWASKQLNNAQAVARIEGLILAHQRAEWAREHQ